jgi:CheY-like chemotaxis protein
VSTILLAEDDGMLRRFVARALEAQGHTVRPVADGRRALEDLSRSEARLIALINFHLPVFSGWHFIQLLAADDHQLGHHAFIFLDVPYTALPDGVAERNPSTFCLGLPAPLNLAAVMEAVRQAETHLGRFLPSPALEPDQPDAASASPAQT